MQEKKKKGRRGDGALRNCYFVSKAIEQRVMRTSRDRYSRMQHGFLKHEQMESNSCVLLMTPPRCLCAASVLPLPNSPFPGKD